MSLGYTDKLRGTRAKPGYWSRYANNWGQAQPPASQALLGGLQGYVAEAAVPRFVSRNGELNEDRNWSEKDKMINISTPNSFDEFLETENRLTYRPLAGYRRTLTEFVP